MKRILLMMLSVLVLFLVACGNSDDTEVTPNATHPLTDIGRPFSELEVYYEIDYTEATRRRMPGFEFSYSEEHGVLLLTPAESIEEIWAEMLDDLVNGYTALWTRISGHLEFMLMSPHNSRPIFVIANPLNPDLFWFSFENGSDITYSAFKILYEAFDGRNLGLDYDPWYGYVPAEPEVEEWCDMPWEWMMEEVPELEIGNVRYDEVVDFLSQFLTIGAFGSPLGEKELDSGNIYVWQEVSESTWERQIAESLPFVSLGGTRADAESMLVFNGTFFDQNGELIADAPFIYPSDHTDTVPAIARSFSLHDLNGDGTPFIVISTVHMTSEGFGWRGSPQLYRFVNGEFWHIHTFRTTPHFFTDNNGRLVVHYSDGYYNIYDFYYLDFTEDGVQIERMVELDGLSSCEFVQTITETRESLDRLPNWTRLEDHVTNLVRQRLGITE